MAKKSQKDSPITKMLVIPDGESDFAGYENPGVVDSTAAKAVIAAFEDQGVDLPIDFHHETLDESKRPNATGWIKGLSYEKGIGIMAEVELSDEAQALIRDKKVKYVSPVAGFNKETHKITRIHSLALTNKPATKKMPEILEYAASHKIAIPDTEYLVAASYGVEVSEASRVAQTMHNAAYTLDSCVSLLRSVGEEIPADQDPIDTVYAAIEYLVGLINEAKSEEQKTMAATETKVETGVNEQIAASLGLSKDAKAEDVVVAIEKMKAKAPADDVKVLREELTALKAQREEEIKVATEARIKGKIDQACKENRINRNNTAQMASVEKVYALSEQAGDELIASMTPIIASGRVQASPTMGTNNSRTAVISASWKEFDASPDARMFDSRRDFINEALKAANQEKVTDKEYLAIA